MDGIINILKPPAMTSFDVVAFLRKQLNIKKIGHTGTLDPMAVGVLPVAIGRATKIIDHLTDNDKEYRAELTLGISTDTLDKTGDIMEEKEVLVNEDELIKAILSFVGVIEQVPPMYSALKVNGKKLCDLARRGIEIERKPRRVNIFSITIILIELPRVIFDVTCSKGTYIRTLCDDIGKKLGCGGHMSFLLRKRSGIFSVQDSITIEEFRNVFLNNQLDDHIIRADEVLTAFKKYTLNVCDLKRFLNGIKLKIELENVKNNEILTIYARDGEFISTAIVIKNNHESYIKLDKLFKI